MIFLFSLLCVDVVKRKLMLFHLGTGSVNITYRLCEGKKETIAKDKLGSLSSDVFERRTSTGSGLFALFSLDFEQIFEQNVSLRVKTLSNTNLVASRYIKREKHSLPVDVRRSKTSLVKLPIIWLSQQVLLISSIKVYRVWRIEGFHMTSRQPY